MSLAAGSASITSIPKKTLLDTDATGFNQSVVDGERVTINIPSPSPAEGSKKTRPPLFRDDETCCQWILKGFCYILLCPCMTGYIILERGAECVGWACDKCLSCVSTCCAFFLMLVQQLRAVLNKFFIAPIVQYILSPIWNYVIQPICAAVGRVLRTVYNAVSAFALALGNVIYACMAAVGNVIYACLAAVFSAITAGCTWFHAHVLVPLYACLSVPVSAAFRALSFIGSALRTCVFSICGALGACGSAICRALHRWVWMPIYTWVLSPIGKCVYAIGSGLARAIGTILSVIFTTVIMPIRQVLGTVLGAVAAAIGAVLSAMGAFMGAMVDAVRSVFR